MLCDINPIQSNSLTYMQPANSFVAFIRKCACWNGWNDVWDGCHWKWDMIAFCMVFTLSDSLSCLLVVVPGSMHVNCLLSGRTLFDTSSIYLFIVWHWRRVQAHQRKSVINIKQQTFHDIFGSKATLTIDRDWLNRCICGYIVLGTSSIKC